jgi:hypothetical protein
LEYCRNYVWNEDRISIYNCEKMVGKLKVRLGMLHLAKDSQYNYIGFDADLSTKFDDFHELVNTIS